MTSEGSPPNAKRRRRWAAIPRWLRLLIIAAAGYATYVVAAWAVQEQFLFPGARRTPAADAESRYPEVQRVWTTGEDGARVEAWYAPGGAASPRGRGPAVMFFHANGDLLDDVWPAVRPYLDRGWSAMCVEYRGYGRSTGRPSQDGIVADCVRFRAWLDARPEVDSGRVIYHGISLGGGVACAVAARRSPSAIVLECTFTSVEDLAREKWLPSWLFRHPFRSREVLARLDIPALIMHGARDEVIPYAHGRRLHAAKPGSIFITLPCGHHDHHSDRAALGRFLDGLWPAGENKP